MESNLTGCNPVESALLRTPASADVPPDNAVLVHLGILGRNCGR